MQSTQHGQIVSFIWKIADDVLRDVFVRSKYRDVILPMVVIRRLDAVLEPSKAAVLDEQRWLIENDIRDQDERLKRAAGFGSEPEIDRLSAILQTFNDLFADAGFTEEDRVKAMRNIEGPIMDAIAGNATLQDTHASGDEQNTMLAFNDAFRNALSANVSTNLQVYKKQQDDRLFRQGLERLVFGLYKLRMTPDRQ